MERKEEKMNKRHKINLVLGTSMGTIALTGLGTSIPVILKAKTVQDNTFLLSKERVVQIKNILSQVYDSHLKSRTTTFVDITNLIKDVIKFELAKLGIDNSFINHIHIQALAKDGVQTAIQFKPNVIFGDLEGLLGLVQKTTNWLLIPHCYQIVKTKLVHHLKMN